MFDPETPFNWVQTNVQIPVDTPKPLVLMTPSVGLSPDETQAMRSWCETTIGSCDTAHVDLFYDVEDSQWVAYSSDASFWTQPCGLSVSYFRDLLWFSTPEQMTLFALRFSVRGDCHS